jgi:hypothetical protein
MTGFYEGTSGEQEPIPHSIENHIDVNVVTKTDKQILQYLVSSDEWVNADNKPELTLDELTDVIAGSPNTNDVIAFSGGNWISAAVPGGPIGLDGLTDVTLTTPTEGDTLKLVGGVWVNVPDPVISNPLIVGDGTGNAVIDLSAGNINGNASIITMLAGGVKIWDMSYTDGDNDLVFTNLLDVDLPAWRFRPDKTFETAENFLCPQSALGSTPGIYWGTLNGTTSIFQNAVGVLTIEADTSILLNTGQSGSNPLIVQLLDDTDPNDPQTMVVSNSGSTNGPLIIARSPGFDENQTNSINTGTIESYDFKVRAQNTSGNYIPTSLDSCTPKEYVDSLVNVVAAAANFSASQLAQVNAAMSL